MSDFVCPCGKQRDDLGLRERRAHAADLQVVGALQGEAANVVDVDLERAGEHVEEPPGAAGAAVVHGEAVHEALVVDGDCLAVLAADVDHQPHAGTIAAAPRAWQVISVKERSAPGTSLRP